MKKFLFGFAALPFLAGAAMAAEALNDGQMDRIVAGADPTTFPPPGFVCPGCTEPTTTTTTTTTKTGTTTTASGGSGPSFTIAPGTPIETIVSQLAATLAANRFPH